MIGCSVEIEDRISNSTLGFAHYSISFFFFFKIEKKSCFVLFHIQCNYLLFNFAMQVPKALIKVNVK